MAINRNFKGVWIPKEVWLAKELTVMEKLFLIEIDSLDNENGCFASNKHFSEFFGMTKGRCTQIIKELERKGLIEITYQREGKQIKKRTIKVVIKLNTLVNKLNRGSKNTKQGYLENAQESNTKSSNTSNSNTSNSRNSAKAKYNDDSPYLKLATDFYDLIFSNNSEAKKPNFQSWADDFRKTVELDGRSIDNLRAVMTWSQNDDFWKGNVLSAKKLREKYDQLKVQSGNFNKESKKYEKELTWE